MSTWLQKYEDWRLHRKVKFIKWWAAKRQEGRLRTTLRVAELFSCMMIAALTMLDLLDGSFLWKKFFILSICSVIGGFVLGSVVWPENEHKYKEFLLGEKIKRKLMESPETAKLLP
jgi:hypothetical protein